MAFLFCVMDCHLLCVQATKMVMPTFSDYFAIFDQYTTNHWIRGNSASPDFRDLNGAGHESNVCFAPFHSLHQWERVALHN
jgi:hypothetical protein